MGNACTLSCFSHVRLFITPSTVARQAPLSMGFSRPEDWSGEPFPPAGALPDPGTEPRSPTLQADSLPAEPPGTPSGKEPACQFRRCTRRGFDPWVGKILQRTQDTPLQYSCLGNPMDRGAWWATVHGVANSHHPQQLAGVLVQPLRSAAVTAAFLRSAMYPHSLHSVCLE